MARPKRAQRKPKQNPVRDWREILRRQREAEEATQAVREALRSTGWKGRDGGV